jgi:hypothetical protein
MNPYADLDAVAVLAAAQDGVRRRRETGRDELLIAAQWAVLHGESIRERDPMTTPGGDGTPGVREYALPELAIATQVHTMTVRHQVADALDLVHRLPLTWRRVLDLECEPWVARRVAALSRAVPLASVAIVDRAVAAAIAGHTPSTVFEIAAAKILEADPDAAAMAREHAARERYVRLSRADEQGYRHVIAKVTAGDAAWVDAMVERVADILALTLGGEHNHDELRSLAFGWLARPAELLELLLTHTEEALDDEPRDDDARPAWATDRLDRIIGRLSAMSVTQLKALRGAGATLFVHLDASALLDQHGVAPSRGDRPGPRTCPGRSGRARRHPTPAPCSTSTPTPGSTGTSTRPTQGPHLAPHRRRHVPLREPDRHPQQRRLRPHQPLPRERPTRADQHHQQPAAQTDTSPMENVRRLPRPRGRPRPASCGKPPTASAPSSTTKAPTYSPHAKPGSCSPHPTKSTSTSPDPLSRLPTTTRAGDPRPRYARGRRPPGSP